MVQKQPNPLPTTTRPAAPPAPPAKVDRKCDCLNFCGDYPWLDKGKVDPCVERQREDAIRAERARRSARIDELLQLLGHPFDDIAINGTVRDETPVGILTSMEKAA